MAKKKTKSRCGLKNAEKVKAELACPEACVCDGPCEDDASWYYKKAAKDCEWVAKKKTKSRCKKKNAEKVKAKDACPVACCGM